MSKENRTHSQALTPRVTSLSLVSIRSLTKVQQEDLKNARGIHILYCLKSNRTCYIKCIEFERLCNTLENKKGPYMNDAVSWKYLGRICDSR